MKHIPNQKLLNLRGAFNPQDFQNQKIQSSDILKRKTTQLDNKPQTQH